MSIEGIPEGWELVRVGKPTLEEFIVGRDGSPVACVSLKRPLRQFRYAIIRKIEKPKQFRPFANEKEAEPFWDVVLTKTQSRNSRFRVNGIGAFGVVIGQFSHSYQEAFELFERIDGTPFGVEVTE